MGINNISTGPLPIGPTRKAGASKPPSGKVDAKSIVPADSFKGTGELSATSSVNAMAQKVQDALQAKLDNLEPKIEDIQKATGEPRLAMIEKRLEGLKTEGFLPPEFDVKAAMEIIGKTPEAATPDQLDPAWLKGETLVVNSELKSDTITTVSLRTGIFTQVKDSALYLTDDPALKFQGDE